MFFHTKKNKDLTKYIILFSDHITQDADAEECKLVLSKIAFCLDELNFWVDRKNPQRYSESLRALLEWLFNKAENKF